MAYQQDLLTRVRNIHWSVGKFTFVSGASPRRNEYWGVSAFSANGTQWKNIQDHILVPKSSNGSTALTCSIRGKVSDGTVDAIMAGGVAAYVTGSGGNEITKVAPILVISTNDGASWTDTNLPFDIPVLDLVGARVHGVGYNKEQRSFYAVVEKPRQEGTTIIRDIVTYRYAGGWAQVGSGAYPAKTIVCDGRAGLAGNLVFGSSQRQDQVIKVGSGIALSNGHNGIYIGSRLVSVGGVPEPYCVAAGHSAIVVGGFNGDDSVHARSFNNGASWSAIPELTGIYGAGQGGGFTPVFTCS